MARKLATVALAAVFVAALVMALRNEAQVECEVCIQFNGARACRVNKASDRERAIYGATSAACVVLSGGVTEGIQCTNTRPSSLSCND